MTAIKTMRIGWVIMLIESVQYQPFLVLTSSKKIGIFDKVLAEKYEKTKKIMLSYKVTTCKTCENPGWFESLLD